MKPLTTVIRKALQDVNILTEGQGSNAHVYCDKTLYTDKRKIRIGEGTVDFDLVKRAIHEIDPRRAESICEMYTVGNYRSQIFLVIHFKVTEAITKMRKKQAIQKEARREGYNEGYEKGLSEGQDTMLAAMHDIFGDQLGKALAKKREENNEAHLELERQKLQLDREDKQIANLETKLEWMML